VTGNSSTCTASASATIVVNQNPVVTVNSETICEGQSATLNPQGAENYTWVFDPTAVVPLTVNPATTTTYTVNGSIAATGCSASAIATVTVNPNPVISVSSPAVCEGENAIFTANGADSYTWSPSAIGGNPLVISPAAVGTYIVTVTGNSLNCTSTAEASLQVNPSPIADFSISVTEGCSPLKVNFADLSQGTITQWEWNYDNTPGSNVNNPEYIFNTNGEHNIQLTVTTDQGCKDISDIKTVNVYSVNAGIASKGTRYAVGESVLLFDASQGASHWFWNLGDGTTQNTLNVTNIYNNPGEYIVQHIVSNDQGCKDTSSITIIVNPLFTLYIPNAFTPNDDGINDHWIFSGESWQLDEFEVYVFDRWGKVVFHTTDVNVNWDGRVNGKIPETQSVYQYRLRVRDKEGIFHEVWGSVIIIL
jgi:gliding motility-associated-like protein